MMNIDNEILERITYMMDNDSMSGFSKIALSNEIIDKLKKFQLLHVHNLIDILNKKRYALDCSDTGTGKTYASIAVVKHLKLVPIIICPLSIIHIWKSVCAFFDVKPLLIINYEKIKKYGYPPYLKLIDKKYIWNVPNNTVVIFDEVHKCKNPATSNGKILLSTKTNNLQKNKFKVLLLSATISESPSIFAFFGYVIGLYNNIKVAKKSMEYLIREKIKSLDTYEVSNKSSLNILLFPENGSRMKIQNITSCSDFTFNQISVDCYTLSESNKKQVNETITQLTKTSCDHLVEINNLRQRIEKYKISILYDLAKQYLDNNISVVIFLNYNKNVKLLSEKLETESIIYGKQTIEERQNIISDFQSNKTNIVICNISCSVGISLHDLHGKQRISLICPSFSSVNLIQALGRIYRVDLKTPAIQKIILCAGTYEEIIYEKIKKKINFIDKLNDTDILLSLK